MTDLYHRRSLLTGLAGACAAGLLGRAEPVAAAEGLETTSIRFANAPATCIAPQYLADELLRADGFTDVGYVEAISGTAATAQMARGEVDFSIDFASAFLPAIDAGAPIKILSGLHVGCYELLAHGQVASVLDLKGKRVGVGDNLKSDPFLFISAMASYVGLDPLKDIVWVTSEDAPMQLFLDRKVDAFIGFGTEVQDLRERKIGHPIVSGGMDRPWSQYFCCLIAANANYIQANPKATKRVLHAILTAADICVTHPEKGAQILVDRGYAKRYDHALQALKEIRYSSWREYDPADTLRFFALRLHENGMIKTGPQEIVARAADWRFIEELKHEI